MEELPERNTPLSRPGGEEPEAEITPAAEATEQPPSTNADGGTPAPADRPVEAAESVEGGPPTEIAEERPGAVERVGESSGGAAEFAGDPSGSAAEAGEADGQAVERTSEAVVTRPEGSEGAPDTEVATPIPASGSEASGSGGEARAQGAEPALEEGPGAAMARAEAAPAGAVAENAAAATEEEAQPNPEEIQVTASGAVVVPGEEAPRAEVPRPKKAAPRPERPTGPRISDLRPGQVLEGTVTRIEKYGAFVNLGLADRRDGLIHISELTPGRVRRVEDVVKAGDTVRARVVSVDLARGRIALSLNDIDADTAREASVGPTEPAVTSMALAFQEAQNRRRDQDRRHRDDAEGRVGDRKRREQEELMRRLSGQ